MEQELSELPFIQAEFSLYPLNAGTLNSSYRLDTAKKSYFIKTFESDEIAGLNRQRLFNIQNELVAQNLSVAPIYLSKRNHFQIDSWLENQTLAQVKLPSSNIIQLLASALARIHNVKVDAKPLDLPAQWLHYIRLLGSKVAREDLKLLDSYGEVWLEACSQGLMFCHNDLALSHITYDEPVRIFDWEYCALSSPYFDLASCIAINQLSQEQANSLCTFYAEFKGVGLSYVLSKVTMMKPLVELTNRLWYSAANLTR